ncbi:phage tail tape measure protein [Psychromarinibacter sp. C21-152]|uniref:Phage tail tape measure protein n=1 Tax=Psychromarinibacter sediminicola TaxID=3033385 RepID=A0AAE3T867_9RHOB|nr:phage tail tape measure protein [Psychromarinibacter sediminicola]MDF0600937.1 phage tail tape measure protein [Psychromarinibacter sediminicola]
MDEIDALDEQVEALETSLGGAAAVAAAFDGELRGMRSTISETGREVRVLSGGISRGLRRAFDGLIFDGMKLSDALRGVAQSMVDAAYNAAMRPVTGHFGGLLAQGIEGLVQGVTPFAKGAAFTEGKVRPFATGGVVSGPVTFPMRGGTGLMGEAGPEAIMPLSRGADGRLGVRSDGGGRPIQVVMNIQTPDAESFRRSQSQVAAQVGRALARGQRNR